MRSLSRSSSMQPAGVGRMFSDKFVAQKIALETFELDALAIDVARSHSRLGYAIIGKLSDDANGVRRPGKPAG